MKKAIAALALCAGLLASSAHGVSLTLNGEPLEADATVYENTTFVSLRAVSQAIRPDAEISWDGEKATVEGDGLSLTAQPGDDAFVYNGRRLPLSTPVRLENCRTLVPVRPLAALLGAKVEWDGENDLVSLTTANTLHDAGDELYWLSHIISAESRGEPMEGKIAVGNVVLNRVASPDFPDTIYGVIFDPRWGGQFEPVRNGTIYDEPTAESVQAAAACLSGANTAGDSLYFLAPQLTENHWAMENRTYVTTIGVHWFYL